MGADGAKTERMLGGHWSDEGDASFAQVTDQDRHRVELHPPRLDAGKIQHALDHLKQVLPRLHHRSDTRVLTRGKSSLDAQELRVAENAIERRAQLVCHHGNETGLGAICQFRCFLGFAQLRLGCLADDDLLFQRGVRRGEVTHRPGEALAQFGLRHRRRYRSPKVARGYLVLYEIVLDAELHRLHGNRFAPLPGYQYDGTWQVAAAGSVAQKFQPGHVG